ncbi:hypothetical protein Leryth_014481 [Lithospermum erythrorhizon]|nr:hypothetical protein Leryth_014481 [Lithospermum erythrorhizon]
MEESQSQRSLVEKLIESVNSISSISEYRGSVKKLYCNLARRLKLLTPMFEEIRDNKQLIPYDSLEALNLLKIALDSAKELLKFGSDGSKIYLVVERETVMARFQEVTSDLEQALSATSFEKLDISDEVKEQVELVLAQFRRGKGRIEAPVVELHDDLLTLYNKSSEIAPDPGILKRLVEKLQLNGITELTQESLALHEMVAVTGDDPEERIEKMSMLLKEIKDFVQTENPNISFPSKEKQIPVSCNGQASTETNTKSPVIPDDFRCPISLELMSDPVIVSTGQTYERLSIEKWLEAGHSTCPKTQQALSKTTLTPNYVFVVCCGQGTPKRPGSSSSKAEGSGLLSTPDSRTQEHAVTALLNLSICEDNKGIIVSSGAIPGIVHVLKKGSMEARENAAATLFSLSVIDENKITIGSSGSIPPLVTLLSEGSPRGKKDAATALFNLSIYQGNKGKAVRSGVIPILMQLLTDTQGSMVDEALAILAILASHSEGKAAIGAVEAVPVLIDFIRSGSPRNKENAAAVLVHLCSGDQKHLVEAQESGLLGPLLHLAQNGTERGKRKAAQLLERLNRFTEQQKLTPASSEAHSQTETQLSLLPSTANAVDS